MMIIQNERIHKRNMANACCMLDVSLDVSLVKVERVHTVFITVLYCTVGYCNG
jgi:hypothetical protein